MVSEDIGGQEDEILRQQEPSARRLHPDDHTVADMHGDDEEDSEAPAEVGS